VSGIAYGLPLGGDIKYADQQTLWEALSHRVEA
jgi:recombinational DNA repair protein RecR